MENSSENRSPLSSLFAVSTRDRRLHFDLCWTNVFGVQRKRSCRATVGAGSSAAAATTNFLLHVHALRHRSERRERDKSCPQFEPATTGSPGPSRLRSTVSRFLPRGRELPNPLRSTVAMSLAAASQSRGGVAPRVRCRSRLALTLAEREEISRGRCAQQSERAAPPS